MLGRAQKASDYVGLRPALADERHDRVGKTDIDQHGDGGLKGESDTEPGILLNGKPPKHEQAGGEVDQLHGDLAGKKMRGKLTPSPQPGTHNGSGSISCDSGHCRGVANSRTAECEFVKLGSLKGERSN